jgi:hypothetical protein
MPSQASQIYQDAEFVLVANEPHRSFGQSLIGENGSANCNAGVDRIIRACPNASEFYIRTLLTQLHRTLRTDQTSTISDV